MDVRALEGTAKDGGFELKNKLHVSKREVECLALLGSGQENEGIAKLLGISVNTVRNHIWNVTQKLNAKNRAHAIALAVQEQIIEIGKRHDLVEAKNSPEYLLCFHCGKASKSSDFIEVPHRTTMVNHVECYMFEDPKCPYSGCGGNICATLKWETARNHRPDYPEVPEIGKVYYFDLDWAWEECD